MTGGVLHWWHCKKYRYNLLIVLLFGLSELKTWCKIIIYIYSVNLESIEVFYHGIFFKELDKDFDYDVNKSRII